jgi:hypothetical protein
MYILRLQSRKALHDQVKLVACFGVNIARIAGANSMPCAKTFEDLFMQVNPQDLEPILPALFRWLLRNKFFKLHPEFKGIGESHSPFQLAIDGEITHKYTDASQHPCAGCPYCLKRTRGKAVWYIHSEVVLSIIGEGGFNMPLFVYRVKKEQLQENASDEELKQECELTALPYLLDQFRKEFPRLPANLLLDSLYAQGPAMEVIEKHHCGFIIVRKAGSLKSLNADIEGQKKLITPIRRNVIEDRWEKEQEVYVFPSMSHQKHDFTIIDLVEKCNKVASSRFAKEVEKTTHWQWIVSGKVENKTVFKTISQARRRWYQEDFFNTMQHRGYHLLHDFSRHPISQSIWQLLMFIAYTLSMLMQLAMRGYLTSKNVAIVNWIKILEAFLVAVRIDFDQPLPGQLRFSFNTS